MPHWQQATDYDFIKNARPKLIAWEFLRRNPHYQKDYQQFITTWRALEQQYGVVPNRDFNAWKKDPRAYRLEKEIYNLIQPASQDCASDDDKLLIECWMGAKWGFYKFPLDPKTDNPLIGQDLTWRDNPTTVTLINNNFNLEITSTTLQHKTAVLFDLNKDLKVQLQSAKQQLIVAQKTLAPKNNQWFFCLRLIDAIQAKTSENQIQKTFTINPIEFQQFKKTAFDLVHGGYRELVNLR